MQCSDFQIQPKTGKGKCGDFLSVKRKDGTLNKYCGSDKTVFKSMNLGSWAKISFRTNKAKSEYKGLKCWLTCCPTDQLSQTEVELDWRQRSGEIFQSCQAAPSSAEVNTCGVKGPVTKIVGGQTAERYKYTWLALLGGTRRHCVS